MTLNTTQNDATERRPTTAKREAAILSLLSHTTIVDAAEAIGMSHDTLQRWLKEPAFRRKYDEARRRAFEQGIDYVHTLTAKAAKTLETVMDDAGVSPAARVTAAAKVLDIATRDAQIGAIMADVMERLDAVERSRGDEE